MIRKPSVSDFFLFISYISNTTKQYPYLEVVSLLLTWTFPAKFKKILFTWIVCSFLWFSPLVIVGASFLFFFLSLPCCHFCSSCLCVRKPHVLLFSPSLSSSSPFSLLTDHKYSSVQHSNTVTHSKSSQFHNRHQTVKNHTESFYKLWSPSGLGRDVK